MNLLITLILAIALVGVAFLFFAARVLLVKNGEFRGTCSSNSEFLRKRGLDCPVCGAKPDEACKNDAKTPEQVVKEMEK